MDFIQWFLSCSMCADKQTYRWCSNVNTFSTRFWIHLKWTDFSQISDYHEFEQPQFLIQRFSGYGPINYSCISVQDCVLSILLQIGQIMNSMWIPEKHKFHNYSWTVLGTRVNIQGHQNPNLASYNYFKVNGITRLGLTFL